MSPPVRVRFAPSPTGYLHVGGARTALFNWLYARHHRGSFVLRVEDTDAARNRPEFTAAILRGLQWLGIDWDEGPERGGGYGPYYQSQRIDRYRLAAERLRSAGYAYDCYCAAQEQLGGGDRAAAFKACDCAQLTQPQRERLAQAARPALRYRVDRSHDVMVDDLVRGEVAFAASAIEDFIIMKNNGDPLYNFAAAVDDQAMAITHIIRGEEHLANTPKQLLLYEAFGWQPPRFAHIPIILDQERRKLSKRHGAAFLRDYETMGFLPAALRNFLALLGWSPGGDRELLSIEEMIEEFALEDVVKHPAIFDVAKLSWMNKAYLKAAPLDDLALKLMELMPQPCRLPCGYVAQVVELLRDRVHTLQDILTQGDYFFSADPVEPSAEALAKYCSAPDASQRLQQVREALRGASDFSPQGVELAIRSLAEIKQIKAAAYIHPLRVALTGQPVSPGIFQVCSIIGQDRSIARIDALLQRLAQKAPTPAARASL